MYNKKSLDQPPALFNRVNPGLYADQLQIEQGCLLNLSLIYNM